MKKILMKIYLNKPLKVIIALLIAIVMVYAVLMALFASSYFEANNASVVLIVSEKIEDKASSVGNPVSGGLFELFKLNDETEEQIGGSNEADSKGKIGITNLSRGNYKFVEVSPNNCYKYDTDDNGDDITEYHFEIISGKKSEVVEVFAYNIIKTGSLELKNNVVFPDTKGDSLSEVQSEKTEQNFEFLVEFTDGQEYKYQTRNADGSLENILSELDDGKLYLKNGESAVFPSVPIGLHFHITQTKYSGFITTSENHFACVNEENNTIVEFTNTPKSTSNSNTVVVKVSKNDEDYTHYEMHEFVFSKNIGQDDEETLKFELADGESKSFELNYGETYSVVGDESLNYTIEEIPSNSLSIQDNIMDPSEDIVSNISYLNNRTNDRFEKIVLTNYTASEDGEKSNSHNKEIAVQIIWQDLNNVKGTRPDDIGVVLLNDGKPVLGEEIILNETNAWKHKWVGKENQGIYSVEVLNLDVIAYMGYFSAISGDENNGFVITNTYNDTSDMLDRSNPSDDRDSEINTTISNEKEVSENSTKRSDSDNSRKWIFLVLICIAGEGMVFFWYKKSNPKYKPKH